MIEPIYIARYLTPLGAAYLGAYAEKLGLQNIVTDMHVTIAYSTSPVDWDAPAFQMDPRPLTVGAGARAISKFDGAAVVLEFESRALSQRWAQFIMAGASWDFPNYKPHVTLAYDEGFDPTGIAPDNFELPFQNEYREWLNTEYQASA